MARGKKTGGRTAGTPNKLTKSAREAYQLAFAGLGEPPPPVPSVLALASLAAIASSRSQPFTRRRFLHWWSR